MSVAEKDLIIIRNSLQKIVEYIDSSLGGDTTNCIHENRTKLTTMGKGPKEFICDDCGKTWEEEFNVDGLRNFDLRVGGPGQ